MHIIILLLCILLIIISLHFDKKIYNPMVLFNIWWGITIFISGFGLYGINIPSLKTYLIMMIAVVSFNLPCILFYCFKSRNKRNDRPSDKKNYKIKIYVKYLIIIQLLVIIELIKRSLIVLKMISSGMSYNMIRYFYFYSDEIISGYDNIINSYFITPIVYFSIILISLMLFQKEYSKIFILTTLICVGLMAFSSGGRDIILILGISLIMAYLIQNKDRVKVKLSKRLTLLFFFFFFLIVICVLGYMTIIRSAFDGKSFKDILGNIVLYFTAPYIYFEELSPYALNDKVLFYGGTFIGGIIDTLILLLRLVGLNFNTISSYIAMHNQLIMEVGNGLMYNAFPTMLYTFLYDFNYMGIIIGPILFGIFVMISYFKMVSKKSLAYKGIYIMIVIMIYESILKWIGTSANPWIVILMFLILDSLARKRFQLL